MNPEVLTLLQEHPPLRDCLGRRVQDVAGGRITPASDALYNIGMARQKDWTLTEVCQKLTAMNACKLTVEDWLEIEVLLS